MTVPDDNPRALVVLESFGPPHGRNNPYFLQLVESFPATVEVRYFSWRAALLGPFDVFHLHWPEVVLRGRTPARSAVRLVLFTLLVLRIRLRRKGLVRTLHNQAPHDPVTKVQALAMRLADRATTLWITLSERIPTPAGAPAVVVPHGHYRDWFEADPTATAVPGRLVFCGRVRRYKGVEGLLRAFADLSDPAATLHVVGRSDGEDLASELRRAAAADPRIVVTDDFVADDVLAREVRQSELVVLPFVEMTNSGSMLLALSLDRPVLVPRRPVTAEVGAEVGPGWVHLYDGALDATVLAGALAAARGAPRGARPDLSGREWDAIGEAHAAAFARARAHATRRSGGAIRT